MHTINISTNHKYGDVSNENLYRNLYTFIVTVKKINQYEKREMCLKKSFYLVGCILIALIIGAISYTNYQEQKLKKEAELIDKSILNDDYKTVSKILENSDIEKLQQYSDSDLKRLKSNYDLAVHYQTLYEKGNYKQFIIDFQTKHFTTNPYYSFGYEYYLKSLHGFIKDDNKKITELSTLTDLDNILTPWNEEEEEMVGEIVVARCKDYFDKNDQKSCLKVMKENNWTDETNDILGLLYSMQYDRTGEERGMLFHYLVELERNDLSSPFKEEYEKLFTKYKDTEEYKYAKELQNIDYDELIIKRPEIGMTPNEVIEIWGNPIDINRTKTKYGTSEQWVFLGGKYVYFDDGFVTAIQD